MKRYDVRLQKLLDGKSGFPVEADSLRITDTGHAVFSIITQAAELNTGLAEVTEVIYVMHPDVYQDIDCRFTD